MRAINAVFVLALLISIFPRICTGQKIDTLKLKPSECPGLPPAIADWLEQRGMIIPLYNFGNNEYDHSDTVLQGQFFQPGQNDWAVLTTDGDSVRVWVFPEGKTDDPSLLIAEAEKQQNWESHWTLFENKYRYCLFIKKLSPDDLATRSPFFGLPAALPAFDHQGIWYGMWDKPGRMQYYNHCGIWMFIPLLAD